MSGRTPKEIRQRREPGRPPKQRKVAPKKSGWRDPLNLCIGLASLVLGIPGFLGLLSGPTVSLGSPLDPNDVFTTPVEINNNGLLGLKDVRVQSYVVIYLTAISETRDEVNAGYQPPNNILRVGETQTVALQAMLHPSMLHLNRRTEVLDIALIAFYKPAFMPFWPKRTAFRFRSVFQSDGKLRLIKVPAGDALEQYDKSSHISP